MSTTETPIADAPQKRKYVARRKRKVAAAPKPKSELTGLTVTDCPVACNADCCVISGKGYCGHPRKGGLQGREMYDNAAIGRLNTAQKALGKKLMDARYG